ncbi:putative N-acetyltransferase YhbS [Crossiella equi]|uniref:N-acetyltransferase YhbS n=1 Tax=Crossiella equi TaxID=130796 RepID=A0ABS5A543_9PSEU|nr:GNAT family N-acetyltransferase [Crossiella equi]MBP2471402.1 putative N-acetyltransferase YhbS [Crossiella equi]
MTGPAIREATSEDVAAFTGILARSFAPDALIRWLYLNERNQTRLHHRFLAHQLRTEYLPAKGIEVAVDESGAVLGGAAWAAPDARKASRAGKFLLVPRAVATMGVRDFGEYGRRGRALVEALVAARPKRPHWYLSLLATDPDRQRGGVGRSLLRHRLATTRLPAYLECVTGNVAYYERYGFRVTGELGLPTEAPKLYSMWREPTAQPCS